MFSNRYSIFVCACAVTSLAAAATQAPLAAFPGAEGFGATTPGGRGGPVVFVANLKDSGPGSFREACSRKGPRILVFRTGGTIDLQAPVTIEEPFITIAGQTAPGEGICLRRYGLVVKTHDVVVRYLRSRPGDVAHQELDGISIITPSENVVIDHCSSTWSVDEALSPSGAIRNITVQWSLIAEALNKSVHSKGAHGYGSLVRAIGGVSLHHNLWAHNTARNPRLGDNYGRPPFPTFDVRNNVIYDYGEICSGMTGDHLDANYVANYIRPGADSRKDRGVIVPTATAEMKFFVDGNVVEGNDAMTADNAKLFDRPERDGHTLIRRVSQAFAAPAVHTTSAAEALGQVLAKVGASAPVRDSVDARIVEQVRSKTGRIIDSQKDAGGWPAYRGGEAPKDSDHDGIPDAWETVHGLNPADAADAVKVTATGYTNLEEYINSLAR